MYELGIIREFKTPNFTVVVDAVEDDSPPDVSWDETNTVLKKIDSGEYVLFCARARVFFKGEEISSDYLGSCIYTSLDIFQDHKGMNHKGHGSYFSDMVHTVIREAKEYFNSYEKPYIRSLTKGETL